MEDHRCRTNASARLTISIIDDPERAEARRVRPPSRASTGADFWAAPGSPPWARQSAPPCRSADFRRRSAHAPGRAAGTKGPQYLELPRQGRQAGPARRPAAGGRDARASARRRHHAERQVLHPQQRPFAGGRQGPRRLEDRGRRRGQPEARAHARRAEVAVPAGDAPHGARMRRQRPLVLHPAGARQPVDQWRRRLRRMDRRAARRPARGRRREAVRGVHRPLRRRPQPGRRQQGRALARRADQEGARRQQPRSSSR